MAKIKVHDLKPTGSELFNDSESFMSELSSDELEQAMGGRIDFTPTIIIISCFCYTTMVPTIFTRSPVIL